MSNYRLKGGINACKVLFKEAWLNFGEFVEVDKCVFKYSFVFSCKSTGNDLNHVWKKVYERLGIFSFSSGKEINRGLQGGKLNV